jgi:endonuclease/exonuclease/phosphatase family metal-dependent hydrolase
VDAGVIVVMDAALDATASLEDAAADLPDAGSGDARDLGSADLASLDLGTADGGEVDVGAADVGGADVGIASTARTFSILNLNVLHGFPGGEMIEARTQIVIGAILALQPDAVLLQEVSITSQRPNIGETIATAVGYDWRWVHAAGVAPVFEEGPAILTRWPILASDDAQLEGQKGATGRAALRATLELPFGEIVVGSTHLTNTGGDEEQASQAVMAYNLLAGGRGVLGGVLGGDMNAEPDALTMRFFRGETAHDGVSGDLIDAWATVRPTDPGFTSPADNPDHRIDYILVLPGTTETARPESCEIMFDQPVGGILASDHLGLYCTFTFD